VINEQKQTISSLTGLTNQIGFLIQKWAAKDIPALKNERFITTSEDYLMRVSFQLSQIQYPNEPLKNYSTSWEEVTKRFREYEDFGSQLKKDGVVKEVAESIKAKYSTPVQQMDAAYRYIQKNFTWNTKWSMFTDLGVRKAFSEKTGNSADLNLLLVMILREMGIEANPLLLSPRWHGKVNVLYPSMQQFRHVVTCAEIDNNVFLMDAISKDAPTGVLPYECLSNQGLVLKDDTHDWVSLYSNNKSVHISNSMLRLNEDGKIEGTIQVQDKLYEAMEKRSAIKEIGEKDYIKTGWLDKVTNIEVKKHKFKNLEDVHAPLMAEYEVAIEPDQAGERIYWSPFIKNPYSENPFKQEERKFPVDFGHPFQKTYLVNLTLPDNYEVEELPKSQIYRLPDNSGEFSYTIANSGKAIQFKGSINMSKPVYESEEYAGIKELFTLMEAKLSEQIVL